MKIVNFSFLLICLFSFSILNAQTTVWTGTTGNWDDPSNWDNGVPTAGTTVNIENVPGAVVTIPSGYSAVSGLVEVFRSTLVIEEGATLDIINNTGFGITVAGINSSDKGTLDNSGTINIDGATHTCLRMFQYSHVINQASGTINIDNAAVQGMTVSIVDNYGSFNLGPNLPSKAVFMGNTAIVNNHPNGQFNILGTAGNGFESGNSTTLTNDGILCINEANVGGTPIDVTTFNNNGTYNTSGCSPTTGAYAAPVPTMGEWALMIFGLIIMSLGVVYVMRWQNISQRAVAVSK